VRSFIARAVPPKEQFQPSFEQFKSCFSDIAATMNAFQVRLALEEQTLNNARERIGHHLDALQPIAKSVDEARRAADDSILPQNEIPDFPIGDVVRLRSLLEDFSARFGAFSDWANQDPQNKAEFARITRSADSVKNILDGYLTPPGKNAPASAPVQQANPPGAAGQVTTPTPTPAADTNKSKATKSAGQATAKASPTPDSGDQTSITPAGGGNPGGDSMQPQPTATNETPGAIIVGSKEVQDYEANREYINQWIVLFKQVATAPPEFFVETFQAPCNGWFGQGASTQMQLTILDNAHPDPTTPPTARNLDKVVCQPVLTITSGLGLSFVPDRTPAFVAGIQKDAQGNPVLDANKNPVIVQTLGFSSSSSIRPAYAMQVDGALWNLTHGMEMHWGLGAMLTAANGGVTTDIITGPAFSFKKRTFFVTPVYDLGLRTVYQNGFTVGQPQGNLTSPPTQQVWKSGFGVTITFPFSSGSNGTSNNSSGNAPATVTPVPNTGGIDNGNPGTGGGKGKNGSTP
jgi:hypothetical protein